MPTLEDSPATKADIELAVRQLREYIDERSRDMQTELLRAFADYNNSANIRFRKLEADTANINASTTQRLGELENQVAEFRMRVLALEQRH